MIHTGVEHVDVVQRIYERMTEFEAAICRLSKGGYEGLQYKFQSTLCSVLELTDGFEIEPKSESADD